MAVREHELDEVVGRVRVDRRTKNLLQRLQPGEIAVIDHEDLDRIAAEGLVAAGVVAVINARPSFSGRYPNPGPLLVVAAGIPLVDDVGEDVMDRLHDGEVVAITGDDVRVGDEVVATGHRPSLEELEAGLEEARRSLGTELERFAEQHPRVPEARAPPGQRRPDAPGRGRRPRATGTCSWSCGARTTARTSWP